MRRYVVIVNLCLSLCIHLVSYGKTDMCSENYKSENLDCFSDYVNTITCIWNKGSNTVNESFFLTLIDNDTGEADESCNLVLSKHNKSFTCDITVLYMDDTFDYKIIVQDSFSKEILETIETFYPCCNIKLDPPTDLSYNFTSSVCNITWGGNSRFIQATRIQYELQLQKGASSLEPMSKTIYDTYVEMILSEFDKGANYIRIRCRTENNVNYKSRWSEWSSELKIEISEGQTEDIIHIITIVTLLTMTLILLLLALCTNLSSRINISFLKKIPTAADFFHPLYHIHNGNFQDWTKYPNKCKEKIGEKHGFPQDADLYSRTVLYFQTEAVSPVKLEPPLSKEDLSDDIRNSTSCSDLLVENELSLTGMYPTFFSRFSSFSNDIINEKDIICSLDCPTDYFSYDGNNIANSQEVLE